MTFYHRSFAFNSIHLMAVWCMHSESLLLKVWPTKQQQLPEESRIPPQTQLQDLHLITILGDPHAQKVWEAVL